MDPQTHLLGPPIEAIFCYDMSFKKCEGKFISILSSVVKCESNKLVECEAYVPFMVKVKYNSYCETNWNDKIGSIKTNK